MHRPPFESLPSAAEPAREKWPSDPAIEPLETRNLIVLAAHQIVFRIGWIFKTESVIMPAFLDALAGPGAGWLRGFMPVLSRLGQSIPPVVAADRLKAMRQKKWSLVALAALMSIPMLGVAGLWAWFGQGYRIGMALGFLALYLAFFALSGLYQLAFGTVQGKLIRPTRRGRLLLISTFWGAFPAALFAIWLLPGWLDSSAGAAPSFHWIFTWVAVCFLLAALVGAMLSEPADRAGPRDAVRGGTLADAVAVLRRDANLRRLVVVAMLFGSSLIVFPHYQALARQELELPAESLMVFVVVQNAAVAIFSLFVGPLADCRGNRLTLRLLILGSAIAPAFAAWLPYLPSGAATSLCWMIFIPLGITPLVLRVLVNYTLEICSSGEHPRYLSTVNLCVAVPFLFAPLAGWAVDKIGFQFVFMATVGLLLLSGMMTFRLDEPRHRVRQDGTPPAGIGVTD